MSRFLCAESHADADFARAEDDDIADGAVDAHRGQQKPEQADGGSDGRRKAGDEEGRRLTKHLLESGGVATRSGSMEEITGPSASMSCAGRTGCG